jgi:hypothetical protein
LRPETTLLQASVESGGSFADRAYIVHGGLMAGASRFRNPATCARLRALLGQT